MMGLGVSVRRYLTATLAAVLISGAMAGSAVAQVEPEMAANIENGPTQNFGGEELLRPENALLWRYEDRLEFELRLDTPVPGTYAYPDSVPESRHAGPELFTMWVFIFNDPDNCVASLVPPKCGAEDASEAAALGVYNTAAHSSSMNHSGGAFEYDLGTDGQVVLKGTVMVGDAARPNAPPGNEYVTALSNPLGAEVHAAIAPHGQVDPATLGLEAYEPAGNPTCGCLWVAMFYDTEGT